MPIKTEAPAHASRNPDVAWSHWDPAIGKISGGTAPYRTVMGWLRHFGRSAAEAIRSQDLPHAVYGVVNRHYDGRLQEIRLFTKAFVTDEALAAIDECNPLNTVYVVHKI